MQSVASKLLKRVACKNLEAKYVDKCDHAFVVQCPHLFYSSIFRELGVVKHKIQIANAKALGVSTESTAEIQQVSSTLFASEDKYC